MALALVGCEGGDEQPNVAGTWYAEARNSQEQALFDSGALEPDRWDFKVVGNQVVGIFGYIETGPAKGIYDFSLSGWVDGNNIAFTMVGTWSDMRISYVGVVDGDKMSLVKTEPGGNTYQVTLVRGRIGQPPIPFPTQ